MKGRAAWAACFVALAALAAASVLPVPARCATAVPQWKENGIALREIGGSNAMSPCMVPDGAGGAIVAWQDQRSGFWDIYAQRISDAPHPPALTTWYLAEGCTQGDMETFLLVQNPGDGDVAVAIEFDTEQGKVAPPELRAVSVPAHSRRTIKANDWVNTFELSAHVFCPDGEVVVERSMYGGDRNWATNSMGAPAPSREWYLAEGCTQGDMETFLLVQNPGGEPVKLDVTFMGSSGPVDGPQGFVLAPGHRVTFKANDFIAEWGFSAVVRASRPVVCERAVYGNGRAWAHDSIGHAPYRDLAPTCLWGRRERASGPRRAGSR